MKEFFPANAWKGISISTRMMKHVPSGIISATCNWQKHFTVFEVTLRNALCRVEEIHQEMITVMGWMNRDVPEWLQQTDRFGTVCYQIRETMQWG